MQVALREMRADNDKFSKEISNLKMIKVNSDEYQKMAKTMQERLQHIHHQHKNLHSQITATDNYISRYLPFNSFCQMLEAVKISVGESKNA